MSIVDLLLFELQMGVPVAISIILHTLSGRGRRSVSWKLLLHVMTFNLNLFEYSECISSFLL